MLKLRCDPEGFGCVVWWLSLAGCFAVAVVLFCGCGVLLTGTTDPGKVQAIMEATSARGCFYTRASGSPWASVVTYLVGAFGDPAPSLEECWKTLPPSSP